MEHARTAPRKDAPRKALACLLAAVLAFSLAGAPVAYGAEAADGPGTEAAAAPGAAQDADAGEGVGGGFGPGTGAGEDVGGIVGPDAALAVEGDADGGAQEVEPSVEPDTEPGDAQAAEPDSVQGAEPAVGPDAGPGVEGEAGDITQGTGSDAAQGAAPDAEGSAVPPAEAGEEAGDLASLASHTIDVSAGVAGGTGYTWDATTKVVTFTAAAKGSTYTLIQTGKQNALGIVVASGVSTTITLKNLNLATELPCIKLEGTANLALSLEGTSELKSSYNAGIEVTQSAVLTIQGKGKLTATSDHNGAGIGSSEGGSGGTITISGGTVTASSYNSAGIGGSGGGVGGNISVTSGTVTATGGIKGGAGIGGGARAVGDPSTSVSIAPAATVRAFAKDAATPAIDAYWGNAGTGHYVLAYLDAAPCERTLAYYAAGSASRTGSLPLPAGYSSFAYTTGSAKAGTHRVFAWQASPAAYLGRAERVYDSSPDIASTLNAAPVALKLNASAAARPPDWQYAVRLDANGGKVGKAASTTMKRAKGTALGALPTPTRAGHAFLGWYTGKATGTRATASTKVTGDATYWAHWKAKIYTVKLDANGGKASRASVRRAYGSAIGKLPKAARANCTFLGWYTAKSGGKKAGTGTRATKDTTYYARWKANGPVVTLDANGGKVGKSARASLVRAKGAAIGKLATPKRAGYTFKGWFTGKVRGTRVTAATRATRSVTLYAHWKAKSYTVKLNANGGRLGKASTFSTKRSHDAKFGRLAAPKRTGYKFDGWYTAKRGGTKVTASTMVTRAVTHYAPWKRGRLGVGAGVRKLMFTPPPPPPTVIPSPPRDLWVRAPGKRTAFSARTGRQAHGTRSDQQQV
ncbi:MAG: InlB B-repeat-containing protein [Coriobacteriales bacterium]|jgi:uncharacterized repeat protein (TIGR02543 family)|nr:InlB B-repeat-containing protein [Coriobacteriales bacterium]